MFIPRTDPEDVCASSGVSCSTSSPSATTSDADDTSSFDPSLMKQPGAHRYIGIGMVIGLLFLIFLVWLYRGNWPRRILRQYCCCCSRRSKQLPKSVDDDREESSISTPMVLEKTPGESETALVKEASGGMVVFTPVPKALGKKDRYPVEWEMEHINDIRLETRTPQRHHARNGSRQS